MKVLELIKVDKQNWVIPLMIMLAGFIMVIQGIIWGSINHWFFLLCPLGVGIFWACTPWYARNYHNWWNDL